MESINLNPPLDLMEIRRQLVALRSLHSDDRRITRPINNLIRKLAHLHRPENRRHEESLHRAITRTVHCVDKILSARSNDGLNISGVNQ
jgi:hypothetical protein